MEGEGKKKSGLGLSSKKDDNFDKWYSELIKTSEMIRTKPDISGCFVLWREAMSIWNALTRFSSREIENMGVTHVYFPTLGTGHEDEHIQRELFWADHDKMDCPVAIAPFCSTYKQEIRSRRNLPLRCYSSGNAVPWATGPNPIPFIRSVEFLWQEGHTAFIDRDAAEWEVLQILELYRTLYEDYLAVPVLKGMKSENETFPGAECTASVEAFIPTAGRGIQGAACHSLGQNYAKMFNIGFQNQQGGKQYVWQNAWGFNTRAIGAMVMVHGDDRGLVLPPKVARLQVIVIPLPVNTLNEVARQNKEYIRNTCFETVSILKEAGIRAEADFRPKYRPGWKYHDWERKGVPLRLEVGEIEITPYRDFRAVRRDNFNRKRILEPNLVKEVKEMLEEIQNSLFAAAVARRNARIEPVETMLQFEVALDEKRLILAPWCDEKEVEQQVKLRTGAKTLCTPFTVDQPELPEGTLCFASGKPAKTWSYWGKTY